MTSTQKAPDLPGIPTVVEDKMEQAKPENPTPEKRDFDEDVTYVAVTGIDESELNEREIALAERTIKDLFLLDLEKSITGVRVVPGEANVLEFEME